MSELKIYLFGSPRLLLEETPLSTDRKKAIALLAYLVITRQAHRREAMATMFWPEYSATKAFAYLRRTIWELNNVLGEGWLTTERDQLSWNNWGDLWLDVEEFQELVANCRPDDESEECLARLEAAARLSQSSFMAGFTLPDAPAFDEWQFFTAESLSNQRSSILQQLSRIHARRSLNPQAVEYARQWIALDALNEEAHRWLMTIYSVSGQRAAALRQYDVLRQALETQLGVSPQPETNALYHQIKHGVILIREKRSRQNFIPTPGRVIPLLRA